MPEPPTRNRRRAGRIPPLHPGDAEGPLEPDSGASTSEVRAYQDRNLELVSRENEHQRSESLRDTIHTLFGWGVKAAFVLYGIAVLAVCWHYLLPERWAWLSPDQLRTVTTVVFSGAITSRGGQYLSRRVR